jgi:cytochrome c553
MNHRIVSGVLAILLLLFVTAALLFAVSVRPQQPRVSTRPSPIPHEQVAAYATCQGCHRVGGDALVMPRTHGKFRTNTCGTCHPTTLQAS